MQRFKAAIPTRDYPENPEGLIRDDNGDFVLYRDAQAEIDTLEGCLRLLSDTVFKTNADGTHSSFTDSGLDDICDVINDTLYGEGDSEASQKAFDNTPAKGESNDK